MRSLPILDASGCYQGNLEGFKSVPPKESVFFQMSVFWESTEKCGLGGCISGSDFQTAPYFLQKQHMSPSFLLPSLPSFLP